MERIIESTVPEGIISQRIDLYLSGRFGYLSRTAWQKEIAEGRVLLNGKAASVKKKISSGDSICYMAGEIDEPEIDSRYSIVYEDDFFIAVNKPGNLPIHPSGVFFNNTLVMLMARDLGGKFYPVHRIDRETSGLILLAKDSASASSVQCNFSEVKKSYLAVVKGRITEKNFSVEVPLGPARNSLIRRKREAYEGAPENALTNFSLIEALDEYSLVKADLVTGRTHQIRAHLSWFGHPIVGDKIYGEDESIYMDFAKYGDIDDINKRAGFSRCALHSSTMIFHHPREGRDIHLTAPLHEDMKALMRSGGFEYENV